MHRENALYLDPSSLPPSFSPSILPFILFFLPSFMLLANWFSMICWKHCVFVKGQLIIFMWVHSGLSLLFLWSLCLYFVLPVPHCLHNCCFKVSLQGSAFIFQWLLSINKSTAYQFEKSKTVFDSPDDGRNQQDSKMNFPSTAEDLGTSTLSPSGLGSVFFWWGSSQERQVILVSSDHPGANYLHLKRSGLNNL